MIRIREIRRADNAAVAVIIRQNLIYFLELCARVKKLINMHCKQQANIYNRA